MIQMHVYTDYYVTDEEGNDNFHSSGDTKVRNFDTMKDALEYIDGNYLFDICELEQVNDHDLQVNVKEENKKYATYVFTFYKSIPIKTDKLEKLIIKIYGGKDK